MFNIGFSELIIVLLIAFLVVGPKDLPRVARWLGRSVKKLRQMIQEVKKDADENAGKWIGLGGHLEENESPEECVLREIREEAGLEVTDLRLRGIITFILPDWGNELTFLYTARTETEALPECAEGELKWIPLEDVLSLSLWEGDRVFIPLLLTREDCFSVKLEYAPGGELLRAVVDGKELL